MSELLISILHGTHKIKDKKLIWGLSDLQNKEFDIKRMKKDIISHLEELIKIENRAKELD